MANRGFQGFVDPREVVGIADIEGEISADGFRLDALVAFDADGADDVPPIGREAESSPRLALMPIDSTTAPAASRAADSPLANHDRRTITGVVPSTPIPRGRRAQDRKWPVFVADFGPYPHGGR